MCACQAPPSCARLLTCIKSNVRHVLGRQWRSSCKMASVQLIDGLPKDSNPKQGPNPSHDVDQPYLQLPCRGCDTRSIRPSGGDLCLIGFDSDTEHCHCGHLYSADGCSGSKLKLIFFVIKISAVARHLALMLIHLRHGSAVSLNPVIAAQVKSTAEEVDPEIVQQLVVFHSSIRDQPPPSLCSGVCR